MAERTHPDRPGHREARARAAQQAFEYPLRREFVEPDWRRIPGYRDVTTEQWESAQWQRAHTVKNLDEFKRTLGDHLPTTSPRTSRATSASGPRCRC